MSRIKELITDAEQLSDWSIEIDPVKNGKETQEIILALKATMKDKGLISLTAPQIGYNKRIFCIKFGDSDYRTFINPMIENNSGMTMSREKCSSIPDKEFIIPRFSKVKFYFATPLGKVESSYLVGKAAYVFQHAMDHLNGLLVSDIGLEIDELFDQAPVEEQEELLRAYAESLDLMQKDLNTMIEEDEELKQTSDAIKFMQSVKEGTTVLQKTIDKKDET